MTTSKTAEWNSFFIYDIPSKNNEEDVRYRFDLKSNDSNAVSIHLQKIDVTSDTTEGSGVHLRYGDLIDISNKLAKPNLEEMTDGGPEDGKKPLRYIDVFIDTIFHTNSKLIILSVICAGEKSDMIDIPMDIREKFCETLLALRSIIAIRKHSSDACKISDILKLLAIRYKEKYNGKTQDFAKAFDHIYRDMTALFGIKRSNPALELNVVPFDNDSITTDQVRYILPNTFDWVLNNLYVFN